MRPLPPCILPICYAAFLPCVNIFRVYLSKIHIYIYIYIYILKVLYEGVPKYIDYIQRGKMVITY